MPRLVRIGSWVRPWWGSGAMFAFGRSLPPTDRMQIIHLAFALWASLVSPDTSGPPSLEEDSDTDSEETRVSETRMRLEDIIHSDK